MSGIYEIDSSLSLDYTVLAQIRQNLKHDSVNEN